MSIVERPQRPKQKGLVFNSSQKRQLDTDKTSTSSKRIKITRSPKDSRTITNVLILSDTHGKSKLPQVPNVNVLLDVVLHCGDFSECGQLEDYHKTITLLASIDAPLKLVIPGNHDLTLDSKLWKENSTSSGADLNQQARDLWTGKEATSAGITFLEDGLHTFILNNGSKLKIYASAGTPNGAGVYEWAFGHKTRNDIYNPQGKGISYGTHAATSESQIEDGQEIDIVMTHGPAKYRLDKSNGGESIGCPHLFRALRRMRPKLHCFGHVHEGYGTETVMWKRDRRNSPLPADDNDDDGIERVMGTMGKEGRDGVRMLEKVLSGEDGKETTFVNAALMGDGHELENLPWLVRLELPLL